MPMAFVNGMSVVDSTALAALEIPPITVQPGVKVWNQDVGAYFKYTISTAALDPNVVVEVAGVTGARWIIDTSDADVEHVNSGVGIEVDNTDPASPIVNLEEMDPDPSGTFTTANVTVDAYGRVSAASNGTPNVTLASAYEFGLAGTPAVDNLLVGESPTDFFQVYFREDGGVTISGQTDSSSTSTPPFLVTRRRGEYISEVAHWDSSFTTGSNTDGAVRHLWSLQSEPLPGTLRYIGTTTMAGKPNDNTGYSPGGTLGDQNRSKWFVGMLNRQGGGEFSFAEYNSDGGEFREMMYPGTGDPAGAQTFYADQRAMSPITGANVLAGSTYAFSITGPSQSFTDPYDMASWRVVLDEMNVGLAQARAHHEWWTRPTMGSTPTRSMQLMGPGSAELSATDCFAFRYNTTSDVLELSVNGGAYSPVTTTASNTGITSLTTDVVATGPGAAAATIQANVVTLGKMATIAEARVIGGAVGAGTATPTALTGAQISAILSGANDTITTAGSNVTDLDTSSLDGDNDGDYFCQATITATGGATDITLQPNAASTNQACNGIYDDGAGTVAGEARTDLLLAGLGAAAEVGYAQYTLASKSGRSRPFTNRLFVDDAGTNYHETLAGVWTGSGNITSLRLHSSVASRIATGSFNRVRRCRNLV
jgi:hypothetical protein